MVAEVTLSRTVHEKEDFSGQHLVHADLSYAVFRDCNFDGADLTQANCSYSDFTNSTFRNSVLYRTNFAETKLAGIVFEPKDCYGIIISMTCETFRGARFSQLWWYGLLMFTSMTEPAAKPVQEPLADRLKALIGAERYVKLKLMFQGREL